MAKAQLTNAGLTLLTNAQGGSDKITFTKMALGDGKVVDISVSSLTALVSQKAEMPIVSKKLVKEGTYQIGAYFSNEHITTGFYWRETGIFAKGNDGKEILYCYVNVGDAPDYISVATDIRLEKYIYQTLSVGNSTTINITVNESEMLLTVADIGVAGGVAPLNENKKIDGEFLPDMNYVPIGADGKIDAVYLPEMDYVEAKTFDEFKTNANSQIESAKTNLNSHTSNKSNPHGVTAEQVGAIAKTTTISGISIFNIDKDGLYYLGNAIDVPTTAKHGYVRVMTVNDTHRTICWQPHNTTTVYVNTMSSGTWLGWVENLTNQGGTLTSHLDFNNVNAYQAIKKARVISGVNHHLTIGVSSNGASTFEHYKDEILDGRLELYEIENNPGALLLRPNTGSKTYRIFGEHNKPTGTYIGNGTNREISVGGIGSALLVYGTMPNGDSNAAIVTPVGLFSQSGAGTSFDSSCKFVNGKLTITSAHYYINSSSGAEYTWVVL